jgi:fumarate reductase (CoM/CoB) subunit A
MKMSLDKKTIVTEVLVVGGGAAGAMAAIKAMHEGVDVLVVTKGPFPSGNTSIALAGYGAALGHADERDNPQVHFEDAVKSGQGLCNQKIVKTWVTKIVEITKEMDAWGIELVKEGDKFAQRSWEGHTYPRMVHHNMATGQAVAKCLAQKSKKMGVKTLEHTIVGGLFKEEEGVVGAWAVGYRTEQLFLIQAKAVVLAMGGIGNLFPMTDNIAAITGEGYSLAFRAGAELIQMEFCHFLPTPCYPEGMKTRAVFMPSLNALINKGGARLYNRLGERFVKKYYPETAEQNRGIEKITRAIGLEICEGRGSDHGGVYLDVSDVPAATREIDFSKIWKNAERAGLDLSYQPIELSTNFHDLIGGVKIDETSRTNVHGLFAAGEAAGGAHGASRLAGSALAEALAFGAIAGTNAAHFVREQGKHIPLDEEQLMEVQQRLENLLSKRKGKPPAELKKDIQKIAQRYLNAGRSEKGLNKALQDLENIERDLLPLMTAWADDSKERASRLRQGIEVDGQLELAKIMATAALCRQESRGGYFGGHYRSDYPEQDDRNWLKNIVLKKEQGKIALNFEPPVADE